MENRSPGSEAESADFTASEIEEIEEQSRLRAPMIYEVLRREGDEEMQRPAFSLWWSGVAAGMSISFSLLVQAILQTHLPETPWRRLITGFGYCVGFQIVVLGRQQLFTENTITAVLPVMAEPTPWNIGRLGRMWGIVLAANITGILFAALFCSFTPVLTPEVRQAMLEISRESMEPAPLGMFFRGVSAGFLIAAMVWLIPSAKGSIFLVITVMTYLIAIGGFAHIVAGSMDAFMLVVNGQLGVGQMVAGFAIPALLGNIVGGSALFALISYAQVANETGNSR